ncbi:hypothetical protein K4F52_009633 [Lecanicillium sp. MT-2017a]|nr:hypothetical protein K4F52_009633 [Lecanicillium sp. MT-2017a]
MAGHAATRNPSMSDVLYAESAAPRHQRSPSNTGNRSAEAAKRKRDRDRDCQRRKRQRDRQYTERLEERIRELEGQLETSTPRKGTDVAQVTAYPPEELVVADTLDGLTPSSQCHAASTTGHAGSQEWRENHRSVPGGSSVPQMLKPIGSTCATSSETIPVIDILYGGSKNPLANLIVEECSKEALLAPEKLAISWAIYKYCRYMHPTATQLLVEHQWCVDLVIWPEIRESMIRNQSRMDMDSAIGLFLCSLRIRGSFNSHFISRQNDGDLEIDSNFYRKFTNSANWGLMETFWIEYPYLVEGLDLNVKIRQQDLLES